MSEHNLSSSKGVIDWWLSDGPVSQAESEADKNCQGSASISDMGRAPPFCCSDLAQKCFAAYRNREVMARAVRSLIYDIGKSGR